jgi:FAD/FMN-containing dehydrogenase
VVEHLGGLVKDNTGYHLPSLLCGSEGTLGVVTAARLRLVPRFEQRVTALVGLRSMADAVALAGHVRRTVPDVDAIEFLTAACRKLVSRRRPLGGKGREPGVYVLVECAGHDDPTDALAEAVGDLPVAVAGPSDPERRAELWAYRESITEKVNELGPPVKLDVTLPAARLARFVEDVPGVLPADAGVWLFGHVADGNVHVNVTGVDPTDGAIDDAVLRLVAMRAIKTALDPAGILNPNALLP